VGVHQDCALVDNFSSNLQTFVSTILHPPNAVSAVRLLRRSIQIDHEPSLNFVIITMVEALLSSLLLEDVLY
jgi:hypothetical protein